jgi:hypothetical protein
MSVLVKGKEYSAPLSDEDRDFLISIGRDRVVQQLEDEQKAIEHRRFLLGDEDEEEFFEENEEVPPYSEWTVDMLKTELTKRHEAMVAGDDGMPADEAATRYSTSGKKSELVARLEADDAEFGEDDNVA